MATLFEINSAIRDLVDTETGEISDFEALETLEMERGEKLKNIGLVIKEKLSFIAECDAEAKRIAELKKTEQNKVERLKNYLAVCAPGETVKDPAVCITWRSSKAVEIDDEDALIAWLMANGYSDAVKVKQSVAVDKTALKAEIESGKEIQGAAIVTRQNVQVK